MCVLGRASFEKTCVCGATNTKKELTLRTAPSSHQPSRRYEPRNHVCARLHTTSQVDECHEGRLGINGLGADVV